VGYDPVAPEDESLRRQPTPRAAIEAAEAVVVASPNILHAEQSLLALALERPVLVEKPMAVTVEEAERVAAAAAGTGLVCGVAMNLRFHPGPATLARHLASGALGPVRLVQSSFGFDLRRWRVGTDYRASYSARAALGGGIALDAIHELDYLLWLLGDVESVTAHVGRVSDLEIDVEDTVVATLAFAAGALGTVDLNFHEPAYRRGCLLVGRDATARWDWRPATVTVSREGEPESVENVACELEDTYRAVVADFVRAIEGKAKIRTSAAQGAAAVRLASAILRSAEVGRRVSP
jgi:predicted dehydrogenase